MPNQPLISICIPTYNGMPYLVEAVESVLCQTYSNIELIICDNNSEDSSWDYICSLKDERIRAYRNETNLGMVGNFRKVIELAQGEWLLLLGNDDALMPQCIELLYKNTKSSDNIAFSFAQVTYIGIRQGIGSKWNFNSIIDGKEYILYSLKKGQNLTFLAASLAPTSLVKSMGISENIFFDWALWLTLALKGDVAYLSHPLASYRYHKGNETNTQIHDYYTHYKKLESSVQDFYNTYGNSKIKYSRILHAKRKLYTRYLWLTIKNKGWSRDEINCFLKDAEISAIVKGIMFIRVLMLPLKGSIVKRLKKIFKTQ